MPPSLTIPELHSLHARALLRAGEARRDLARGRPILQDADLVLRTARLWIDAARNARGIIEQRRTA